SSSSPVTGLLSPRGGVTGAGGFGQRVDAASLAVVRADRAVMKEAGVLPAFAEQPGRAGAGDDHLAAVAADRILAHHDRLGSVHLRRQLVQPSPERAYCAGAGFP